MESLAPVLVDELELLLDLLPRDTHVLVCDPERVTARAHDLVATSEEFLAASWAGAAEGGATPIDLASAGYRSLADVRGRALASGRAWWSLSPFGADEELAGALAPEGPGAVETRRLGARAAESYRGDTEQALADLKGWLTDGFRVVLTTEGHGPAQRFAEVLGGAELPARVVEHLHEPPEPGVAHIVTSTIESGFV